MQEQDSEPEQKPWNNPVSSVIKENYNRCCLPLLKSFKRHTQKDAAADTMGVLQNPPKESEPGTLT